MQEPVINIIFYEILNIVSLYLYCYGAYYRQFSECCDPTLSSYAAATDS